jgi:hypothetical protein
MNGTLIMVVFIVVGTLLFWGVNLLRGDPMSAAMKRMRLPRTNPFVVIGVSCAFWIVVGLILWIFAK